MERNVRSASARAAGTTLALTLALALTGCAGAASSSASAPSASAPGLTASGPTSAPPTDTPSPSVTASPSATTTPTATAAAVHHAKKGEPPLYAVAGFTYSDVVPSQSVAAAMAAGMNKSAKGLATASSSHVVTAEDGQGMLLVEITIGSKYRGQASTLRSALAHAVASFGGGTAHTKTISKERVSYAAGGSDLAYGWYHDGTMVYVLGGDETDAATAAKDTARFVTGFLAAAHA